MDRVRMQWKVGVAVLGLVAGMAAAQDSDFKKPLSRSKERPEKTSSTGGSNQTRIFSQEGDDTYEIVMNNGQITAKINGKKVPAERIRRSKDKVEILDKDGEVLKSFDVAGNVTVWGGPGQVVVGGEEMPKPKVMIGITMSEDDDGIVVDHVYDDLPAAKAGLKAQDVIISVDGEKGLDSKAFREALNKKEPGDKVKLKVRRDGEEKDIAIELQKFDGERLGQFQWRGQLKGMEGMEGMPAMPDVFKDHPEAWEQFNRALKNMPEGQRAFVWGAGPEGDFKFTPFAGPDARRMEEMKTQMDKKIAELDEKLARLNEQMARLEKLINKLSEREGGR